MTVATAKIFTSPCFMRNWKKQAVCRAEIVNRKHDRSYGGTSCERLPFAEATSPLKLKTQTEIRPQMLPCSPWLRKRMGRSKLYLVHVWLRTINHKSLKLFPQTNHFFNHRHSWSPQIFAPEFLFLAILAYAKCKRKTKQFKIKHTNKMKNI